MCTRRKVLVGLQLVVALLLVLGATPAYNEPGSLGAAFAGQRAALATGTDWCKQDL